MGEICTENGGRAQLSTSVSRPNENSAASNHQEYNIIPHTIIPSIHSSRLASFSRKYSPKIFTMNGHSDLSPRDRFLKFWPQVKKDIIDSAQVENLPADALDWFEKVRPSSDQHHDSFLPSSTRLSQPASARRPKKEEELTMAFFLQNLEYNTPGGKLNRGTSVVDTLQILKGRELDQKEYHSAAVLGWCVELVIPIIYSLCLSFKKQDSTPRKDGGR